MKLPPAFDETKFLENLLLDEYREAYTRLDKQQRALIRFAYMSGYLRAMSDNKEAT